MVKAVLFDMDGTIADTLGSIAAIGNAALTKFGFPAIETQRYRQLVGDGRDRLIHRMLAECGQDTEENFRKVGTTYDEIYASDPIYLVAPYPGILEMLDAIRRAGVKTAVISNKPDDMTCAIGQTLFAGRFDVVHGQRAGIPKKPDPTAVHMLCEELGVTPAQCLYVGDSGVDMQTANNAGIHAVGVTWGFRDRTELLENGAQTLVDTAQALQTLILQENTLE